MPVTVGAVVGGVQAVAGLVQTISGNRKLKALARQRRAYQMPDETYDAFNLSVNQAQSGIGANSMQYLTTQTDRALTASLNASQYLGGNPNDMASIFDANMQNIMKTAMIDDDARLKKMNAVYQGLTQIAQGKDAEYASQQNMIKDAMAREAQKVQAGEKNMQSGVNMALGALANNETNKLYKEDIARRDKQYNDWLKTQNPSSATSEPTIARYTNNSLIESEQRSSPTIVRPTYTSQNIQPTPYYIGSTERNNRINQYGWGVNP